MVIRTDRKTRTEPAGQTSQGGLTGQTDLTFKIDFPGKLCRAAFAILSMFDQGPSIVTFLSFVIAALSAGFATA